MFSRRRLENTYAGRHLNYMHYSECIKGTISNFMHQGPTWEGENWYAGFTSIPWSTVVCIQPTLAKALRQDSTGEGHTKLIRNETIQHCTITTSNIGWNKPSDIELWEGHLLMKTVVGYYKRRESEMDSMLQCTLNNTSSLAEDQIILSKVKISK